MSRNPFGRGFDWLAAVLFGALLIAAAPNRARAEGDACKDVTDYSQYLDPTKPPLAVVIDANTGEHLTDRTSFPLDEKVRLVFVHKNPVRYDYKFVINRRLVEGDTIVRSLALLGMSFGEKPAEAAAAAIASLTTDVLRALATSAAACRMKEPEVLRNLIQGATGERARVLGEYGKAVGDLSAKLDEVKGLQKAIFDTVPGTPTSSYQLCTISSQALAGSRAITGYPSHSRFVERLAAADKELEVGIGAAREVTATPECKGAFKLAIAAAVDTRRDLAASIKTIKDEDAKLTAAKKELEPFSEALGIALSSATGFVETRAIGPAEEASEYDVSIVRTDRTEKKTETTVKVVEVLKLGRPRFSFSGGIAAAFSDQRRFERQAAATSGEIVGVGDESDAQIGVVGQLNGQIWQFWKCKCSLGWSLGASVTDGEDDTQFGFYTGLTLGALRDHLFLTAAYHLHKETRLSAGFEVGGTIPDGFEGEIPTTTSTEGSLLVSVTYRIK